MQFEPGSGSNGPGDTKRSTFGRINASVAATGENLPASAPDKPEAVDASDANVVIDEPNTPASEYGGRIAIIDRNDENTEATFSTVDAN